MVGHDGGKMISCLGATVELLVLGFFSDRNFGFRAYRFVRYTSTYWGGRYSPTMFSTSRASTASPSA